VDAGARERIEIDSERGDERLALARLHLCDLALVQHHAANELHVEVALAQRALCRLAHGRERRHQQIVERSALLDLAAEVFGAQAQVGVAQFGDLRLQRVDRLHARPVTLDAAIVGRAEDFCREAADRGEHQNVSLDCQRAAGHGSRER
jgi:hypothetical protein